MSLGIGSAETTRSCGMLSFLGSFSDRRRRRVLILILILILDKE